MKLRRVLARIAGDRPEEPSDTTDTKPPPPTELVTEGDEPSGQSPPGLAITFTVVERQRDEP